MDKELREVLSMLEGVEDANERLRRWRAGREFERPVDGAITALTAAAQARRALERVQLASHEEREPARIEALEEALQATLEWVPDCGAPDCDKDACTAYRRARDLLSTTGDPDA